VGISSDLVINVGADLSDLSREFARGPQLAARFADEVTRASAAAFAPPRIDDAAFGGAGQRAGRAMAAGLTGTLQTDLAGEVQALSGILEGLDLGALRPGDLGALRAMADEVRGVAVAADDTVGELRLLDEIIGQVDAAAFDRLVGGVRQTEAGVQALTRYARELNQTLALAARNSDVTDPAQVANVRESIRLQREHLAAIQASIPALGQLADIERTFEASVSRGATSALRERDQAFAAQLRTLGLYGRTLDATSADAVASWRTEAAAVRALGADLDVPREAMLRLDATVQQVERSFTRAQNAARRVVPPIDPTPVPNPRAAESVNAVTTDLTRFRGESARAANAAVAVAFGIEALARAGDGAESGLRTALRAVAAFAAPFGVQGLLVSGIAAAAAAILDFTQRAGASETAAKAYGDQLRYIREQADGAHGALVNLSTAQLAQRRLTLADDLRKAREEAVAVRRELVSGLTPATGVRSGLQLFQSNELRQLQGLVAADAAALDRGAISAADFGQRLAEVGTRYPDLTPVARGFLDLTQTLQATTLAAREAEQGLQQAATVPGRAPDGRFVTALRAQIEQQRALNAAQRTGGVVERDALQTAARAFADWQATRRGAADGQLTFTEALKASNTEAQRMAQALQADARELTRLTDGAKAAKDALQSMQDRTGLLTLRVRVLADTNAPADLQAQAVAELGTEYARTAALAQRLAAAGRDNTRVLEQQAIQARALDDVVARAVEGFRPPDVRVTPQLDVRALTDVPVPPVTVPFTASQVLLQQLAENAFATVQRLTTQQGQVEIQVGFADIGGTGQAEARRALAAVNADLERARAALARYVAGLAPAQQAEFWQRIGGDANKAAGSIGTAADAAGRFGARMAALGDITNGIGGIAQAFGHVSEGIQRAISNVGNLFGALGRAGNLLEKLRQTNPAAGIGSLFQSFAGIGSIVGVIGSAAGLLSGLFHRGPSATERLLDANNARLDALRQEMGALRTTLGTLTIGQGAAQALASNRGLQTTLRLPGFITDNGEAYRAVVAQLQGLGLTFGQLNALAQQFDIALINEKGRVVAGAFQQLADVLALQREKMLRLDGSVGSIIDRLNTRADLFDVGDDPVRQFADQIAALQQVAPNIASLFQGLDVGTAAGRDAADQMLRRLFDQVTASNEAALGLLKDTGFTSVDEFLRVLLGADHALDALTQTTTAATAALGNVPEAFKKSLDFLRFQTMAPTPAPTSALAPVPLAATPTALPIGTTSPSTGAARVPVLVEQHEWHEGAIQINAAGMSADEIYDTWERRARQRATQNGGALAPLATAWESR
jgi:hypothetical protein